jgi:ketosteroid isomerase-like protein
MKRSLLVVTLSLVAVLFAFAQFGCAGPQSTTSTNANMATPVPTPDKAAIEAELTRIEKDWPRVLKDHDAEAIRRVEADDIVEIVPDGSTTTKAQDIIDVQAGNLTADSWDVAETKVTVLDNDAAFVSGRSVIKGGKVKGPGGKTIDISGEYRFIDTFARRDGLWKLVASASVKIQQPAAAATPSSPSPSPAMKASPATKASPTAKPSPATKASPAIKAAPASSPAKTKTP